MHSFSIGPQRFVVSSCIYAVFIWALFVNATREVSISSYCRGFPGVDSFLVLALCYSLVRYRLAARIDDSGKPNLHDVARKSEQKNSEICNSLTLLFSCLISKQSYYMCYSATIDRV